MLKDLIEKSRGLIAEIDALKNKKQADKQEALLALAEKPEAELTSAEMVRLKEAELEIAKANLALEDEKRRLEGGTCSGMMSGAPC